MNRRSFLAGLATAFVVDPERLLWVPGKKTISIPKPRPFIAGIDLGEMVEIREYIQISHNLQVLPETARRFVVTRDGREIPFPYPGGSSFQMPQYQHAPVLFWRECDKDRSRKELLIDSLISRTKLASPQQIAKT